MRRVGTHRRTLEAQLIFYGHASLHLLSAFGLPFIQISPLYTDSGRYFLDRLRLMALAVVFPEIITTAAWSEKRHAQSLLQDVNRSHGHLSKVSGPKVVVDVMTIKVRNNYPVDIFSLLFPRFLWGLYNLAYEPCSSELESCSRKTPTNRPTTPSIKTIRT